MECIYETYVHISSKTQGTQWLQTDYDPKYCFKSSTRQNTFALRYRPCLRPQPATALRPSEPERLPSRHTRDTDAEVARAMLGA
jgi:hypothetical protein